MGQWWRSGFLRRFWLNKEMESAFIENANLEMSENGHGVILNIRKEN